MGSYGIGVSRLVGAIIEAKYEKDVMKWPKSISPYDVVIIPNISKNNNENLLKGEKIYNELKKQNIDVLLDDVDENMSQKFKKHDLIGIPYQIIIGSKSTENKIEFKEVNSESSFIELKKTLNQKSKIKVFSYTERLIAIRNLKGKKKTKVFKSYIIIFFPWNYAWGSCIDNCNVCNERISYRFNK